MEFLLASTVFVGIMFVIAAHEAGHFFTARSLGLAVHRFSVGIGPAIFKGWIGKTQFRFGLIPFGGYVSMVGQEFGSDELTDEASLLEGLTKDRCPEKYHAYFLDRKHWLAGASDWKKLLLYAAGPFASFVAAAVLIFGVIYFKGVPVESTVVEISEVVPNSPAEKAGLNVDDKILSVDGEPVVSTGDVAKKIRNKSEVKVVCQRGDKTDELVIVPENGMIGIYQKEIFVPCAFKDCFFETANSTKKIMVKQKDNTIGLITGEISIMNLRSIIGISHDGAKVAKKGFSYYIMLLATISIALGVMNLLPIPVLDGWGIFSSFLRMIDRRLVPKNAEFYLKIFFGILLMLGSMILVIRDIYRIFA